MNLNFEVYSWSATLYEDVRMRTLNHEKTYVLV